MERHSGRAALGALTQCALRGFRLIWSPGVDIGAAGGGYGDEPTGRDGGPLLQGLQHGRHRSDHQIDVARYFKGCNTGDIDLMVSCFTDDVEAYFIDVPSIRGSRELAEFWRDLNQTMGARWTVDRGIEQGSQAVVTPPEMTEELLWRGTDWFIFEGGRIREIRQYHHARTLAADQTYELMGYPYAERGYPLRSDLDSKLP